jgi:hypothetical protein
MLASMANPRVLSLPGRRPRTNTGGNSNNNTVKILRSEWERVYDFRAECDLIFACENKITTSVLGHGLTLKLLEFDNEVDVDPNHLRWAADEMLKFAQEVLSRIFVGGPVVCGVVPSSRYPGEMRPFVRPWNYHELSFKESSSSGGRRYYVELTDEADQYGAIELPDGSSVQDNPNNRGYPMYNGGVSSMIFVPEAYQPTHDGRLRSPVAMAQWRIGMMNRALSNNDYSGAHRARPGYFVEISKNVFQEDPQQLGGMDYTAEGDLREDQERYQFQRSDIEERSFRRARAIARRSNLQQQQQDTSPSIIHARVVQQPISGVRRRMAENPNLEISPFENYQMLGVNQTAQAAPVPAEHPGFDAILEHVLDVLFITMRIPSLVLNSQDSNHAADPMEARLNFDELVQEFQRMLKEILMEAYRVITYEKTSAYLRVAHRALKRQLIPDAKSRADYDAALEKANKGPVPGASKFANFPEMVSFARQNEASRAEGMTPSKMLKKTMSLSLRQGLQQAIEPVFSFNHVPAISLEVLAQLRMMNAISEDAQVRLATSLYGIEKEDALLTQEERDKDRERQEHHNMELTEQSYKLSKKYEIQNMGKPKPPEVGDKAPKQKKAKTTG